MHRKSSPQRRQRVRTGILLISFFLFPALFYYLSPVLIIKSSIEGVINGSFIIFGLLFGFSLILGRSYCGWVCPAAGCQEIIFGAVDKKVRKGNIIKWIIWLPWILAIALFAYKAGGYHSIDFFYDTTLGLSIGNVYALITYYIVLFILIVLPGFLIGKRSFCHHFCWMAGFMIIGRKIRNFLNFPALRLQTVKESCQHCHSCTESCPMSLPVEKQVSNSNMENAECVLCGSCVDICENSAIRFSFSRS